MELPVTTLARQHPIATDFDVVTMRQGVRQMARELGLSLSHQAKIATAISTIARALVAAQGRTTVHLSISEVAPHPALVVTCRFPPGDLAELENLLRFGEVRALVDEAALQPDGHGVELSLRMWLRQ